ncbi:MAG: transcriptional regulator NrdR [Fibromonadaceae bacterium]|jgi:transcriptional repressor NrdR|nr:transcriptional regulator NrdR [Fibromonadaceae bacterium]
MICPHCKADNDKVIETRPSGDTVRRRRECLECATRFTTYEYVEKGVITVAKRDGRRESFRREKLVSGIRMACAKRPVSSEKIEEMATIVENKLAKFGPAEISYDVIGDLVMKELFKADSVAYVRFASVYKEFREVGEFVKLVMEDKG